MNCVRLSLMLRRATSSSCSAHPNPTPAIPRPIRSLGFTWAEGTKPHHNWEVSLLPSTPLLTFWVMLLFFGARWTREQGHLCLSNKTALARVCPQTLATGWPSQPREAWRWPRRAGPSVARAPGLSLLVTWPLSHARPPAPAR